MGHPAIIRHGSISAEEMAEIFGIPVSRVKTIEQALIRSGQKKKMARSGGNSTRTKKRAGTGTTGKKRSASKIE
jgi:hypothetical protein